jgi:energy-coupling factor transport system ATP-binding protein
MAEAPVAPPVVELGLLAGWRPLPLSVRDARRAAGPLRERLGPVPTALRSDATVSGEPMATARRLSARYANHVALRSVSLDLRAGEIVALMGRNGAGKSTLLNHLAGVLAPAGGEVTVNGLRPHDLKPAELVRNVGLVPPDPSALLYEQTVQAEMATADREHRLQPGATLATLASLGIELDPERHPRDLSEGQRLALALSVVIAPAPSLVLLDEPTRGLDYDAKLHLGALLTELASRGHAIILATHDVELVAAAATRAIVLADGEVVSDGVARDVVCHSPVFAPQTAKILAPDEWLTVAEVRAALIA